MKLFGRSEVWEIGPFQLENILTNIPVFWFFDLSKSPLGEGVLEMMGEVLSPCVKIRPEGVLEELKRKGASLEQPVVLICEDGKRSRKVALRLTKSKYLNVYVVAGGKQALAEYFKAPE
ncbi:MAG: rhodanese-like domain-containing protein [Bdellovibrionaceae bacterium]|nr:rhodanese-like domain-containing protein [Bdellovibrionales bacterium]MCB9086401.1 rhodanese-like domain-containing protein [Pseudobdellovibrionaceae bacterium]